MVISESSFSKQSIALVQTTKIKKMKHYVHLKQKKQTEKKLPKPRKQTIPRFGAPFTTSGQETEWAQFLQPPNRMVLSGCWPPEQELSCESACMLLSCTPSPTVLYCYLWTYLKSNTPTYLKGIHNRTSNLQMYQLTNKHYNLLCHIT